VSVWRDGIWQSPRKMRQIREDGTPIAGEWARLFLTGKSEFVIQFSK
jgi:hypothetical protein